MDNLLLEQHICTAQLEIQIYQINHRFTIAKLVFFGDADVRDKSICQLSAVLVCQKTLVGA